MRRVWSNSRTRWARLSIEGLPVSQQAILAKFGLRILGPDEAILRPVKALAADAGAADPIGGAADRYQRSTSPVR
jgi:hypothetical protein